MQIVGVEVGGGSPVFAYTLGHGEDPHQRAWEDGYKIIRPLSATGTIEDLVVTVQVTPHGRLVNPRGPQRTRGVQHVREQRPAGPGLWSLPGGGIDEGEGPAHTVQREVYEETGQHAEVKQFIDVQTDHWIGLSPTGVIEDFHAVRLIYAANCHWPTDPIVHDAGGTTADSAWVRPDRWRELPWATGAMSLLNRHAPNQLRLWRWEQQQRLA